MDRGDDRPDARYTRDWPKTLGALGGFDFQTVVGGHGGVQRSRERLPQLRAYLEELDEIVARAKEGGVPLDNLQQTVTASSLKSLGGGNAEYLAGEVKAHDFRAHLTQRRN